MDDSNHSANPSLRIINASYPMLILSRKVKIRNTQQFLRRSQVLKVREIIQKQSQNIGNKQSNSCQQNHQQQQLGALVRV